MNIVFLFGAGASYGSGECFPDRPPLGKDLFPELVSKGGIAATVDEEHRQLFDENFEKGMARFIETRNIDLTTLLREMSEYFVPFTPGSTNMYRRLANIFYQKQNAVGKQDKLRVVFATLNYELLLEQALLNAGCSVVYPKNPGSFGRDFTYLSNTLLLRRNVLNNYWARYNATYTVRAPAFTVLKLHGSCNFLPDLPPDMLRESTFEDVRVILEAPVRPTLPAEAVLDYLRQADSLAPAISMYAKGKQVLFSERYVLEHQRRFQAAVKQADKVFLVGIRVWPPDTHIWDHIAAAEGWLGYVGREPEEFSIWCEEKNRSNSHVLASSFEDALPLIVQEIDS